MNWQSIETMPKEGFFLVETDKEYAGCKYSVMNRMKISNGILDVIGGQFADGYAKPIRWAPIEE